MGSLRESIAPLEKVGCHLNDVQFNHIRAADDKGKANNTKYVVFLMYLILLFGQFWNLKIFKYSTVAFARVYKLF